MGVIHKEPKLGSSEEVILRYGAGYFPTKIPICHGGILYLTNFRVIFRQHNVDLAITSDRYNVDLSLSDVVAVGSTPPWRALMGRRLLRIDVKNLSYLFLFSIRHPRWRPRYSEKLREIEPTAALRDGWGVYGDGNNGPRDVA